jgi:type IV pilus assembly protein PilY1
MTTNAFRALMTAAVAAGTLLFGVCVHADDTELLVGPTVTPANNRPNILFILDTSGSMDSLVTANYDHAETYAGTCTDDKIYWRRNNGDPPDCSTAQWVYRSAFKCDIATQELNTAGYSSQSYRAAQWQPRSTGSTPSRWENIRTDRHGSPNWVECRADAGIHGDGVSTTRLWAANNTSMSGTGSTRGPWNATAGNAILWNANNADRDYYFYTANYINWYNDPNGDSTRIKVMKQVLSKVLDDLSDVNAGLMRYSNNNGEGGAGPGYEALAQGGMVVAPMQPIETGRDAMKTAIKSWNAWGMTPLSETLYEATQYLRGGSVFFGDDSRISPNAGDEYPSVASSRAATNDKLYDSPMDLNCQKTYIVFLTDGLPTADQGADSEIESLIGAKCNDTGNGRCLDDLSRYLFTTDLRDDAEVAGIQNITSYWIGFGDISTGAALLERTATLGGGKFYGAADTPQLVTALSKTFEAINRDSTSFTAPTVAVNAFNRTQNLNDLYVSVFTPNSQYRWEGNVKKYRITSDGLIVDANGVRAVDTSTGFFELNAQSFWSTGTDGREAGEGGAASKLTDPAARTIYSNLNGESGALAEELSELKDPAKLLLANTLVLGVPDGAVQTSRPAPADLVDWIYGVDVYDSDGDGDTTDARADMGDPLHARPGAVIYGGTAKNPDLTLYATTNDGVLHAIDATADLTDTTVGGKELWAFMPRELLGRLEQLVDDATVTNRGYGLDGEVEVVRLDRNRNGIIEMDGTDLNGDGNTTENEKDKVYLFFGMRRGGSHYYGLDVTDRDAPRLMWRVGAADPWLAATDTARYLPEIGQTWSTPTVARVNVDGHDFGDNVDKLVLIVGGGYAVNQDAVPYSTDTVGNRVYMLDALTGELLWRAGDDAGANLRLAKMTNAIPGDVRALDLTGDGFADRMYAADMGGRVWRFDIRNGQDASNLVKGGVFASLGVGDLVAKPDADNRRFFYAPDVSFISDGAQGWINVAIGSGHREMPVSDKSAVNRFYSLRDYNRFTVIDNAQYKATCGTTETSPCHQIITDSDTRLVNITPDVTTPVPANAAGWKLTLTLTGEKTLAESRTFQNQIYFTSFEPSLISTDPTKCSSRIGINRLYVVDSATGKPVRNFDVSTGENASVSDRSKELKQQGTIAPEAIFIFPTPDDPADPRVDPLCLIGLENCGGGLNNPPVRTYWEKRGSN